MTRHQAISFTNGTPGIYKHPFHLQLRSRLSMKWTDLRSNGIFYSVMFEAMANPKDRIRCQEHLDAWVQKPHTVHLTGMWERTLNWTELQVGDRVQGQWDPLKAVPPHLSPLQQGLDGTRHSHSCSHFQSYTHPAHSRAADEAPLGASSGRSHGYQLTNAFISSRLCKCWWVL